MGGSVGSRNTRLLSLYVENVLYLSEEFRDPVFDQIPKNVFVEAEIAVSDYVAQTGDTTPVHFWIFGPDGIGNVFCRFADYLEI